MRQTALVVDGSVAADQREAVEKVKKAAKTGVLADLNNKTYQLEIEVKLQPGTPMIEVKEVIDIWKQEETTISHKQG